MVPPRCVLFLCLVVGVCSRVRRNCLKCICEVEGCGRQKDKCRMDLGSLSCGPYQIKKDYWIDCGRPKSDYTRCAKKHNCSKKCIKGYMNRYARSCTMGRRPRCQDYARIHNGGPTGCRQAWTSGYWDKVKKCCRRRGGC